MPGSLSKEDAMLFARERREEIVSTSPFVVRRAARWSECDPAGVVYAGNFPEFMLSAVQLFRRHVLEGSWQEIRDETGIDTPSKAISMVFNGSLWPDDVFDTAVTVGEIRNRSFDFEVSAVRATDRSSVFTGKVSAICISAADRRTAVPVPEQLRRRLLAAQLNASTPKRV